MDMLNFEFEFYFFLRLLGIAWPGERSLISVVSDSTREIVQIYSKTKFMMKNTWMHIVRTLVYLNIIVPKRLGNVSYLHPNLNHSSRFNGIFERMR